MVVEDVLTKEFLRKYIYYAKKRASPVLSEEASEAIGGKYATMRAKSSANNLPITARTLETIIRVATAHAKARIADTVDAGDVDAAVEIINFCLFHEIGDDVVNNGGGGRRVLNARSSSGNGGSSRGSVDMGLDSQLSPDRPNKRAKVVDSTINDENRSSNINQPENVLEQNQAQSSVDLRPLVIEAIQSLGAENPDEGIRKDSLLQRLGRYGESVAAVDTVLEELANEAKIYIEDYGGMR